MGNFEERQDFCQTRWAPIRLFFCWSCSPGHPNRASASLIIMEGHIQQSIMEQSIMEQSIIQQSIMGGHTERRQLLSLLSLLSCRRGVSRVHTRVFDVLLLSNRLPEF